MDQEISAATVMADIAYRVDASVFRMHLITVPANRARLSNICDELPDVETAHGLTLKVPAGERGRRRSPTGFRESGEVSAAGWE